MKFPLLFDKPLANNSTYNMGYLLCGVWWCMQEHGQSHSAIKASKAQEHEMLSESPEAI